MNLVIHGPQASPAHAAELASLTGASAVEGLGLHAYRLRDAGVRAELAAWCEVRRLDWAWVPAGRRFADLKLVAMDMDSTLITIECIDEIGGMLGIKPEIATITEAAMRGEIDYAQSLLRRVALLAGLEVSALDRVYEEKLRLSPGAERLVERCKREGIRLLLVSGGFTFFTDRLKARLGIDHTLSNTLEIAGGRLTGGLVGDIVDADAKAARFREVAAALGAAREDTVAMGDGVNDLKMMAEAGLSVAYRPKPLVRARASCAFLYCGLDGLLNLYE
ncbi:MAG: phosphoserine phosphatase SerB [Betaproteobacteria bacterium]|nr:phosphoserine phosphatase SerB [Betaproteobacteria bacterium]